MAYTNPYNPAEPAGGDNIALGDDVIRKDKDSLIARLSTVLDGVPDVDPWTLKANSVNTAAIQNGAVTSAKLGAFDHVIKSGGSAVFNISSSMSLIPLGTLVYDSTGTTMSGTANQLTAVLAGLYMATFTCAVSPTGVNCGLRVDIRTSASVLIAGQSFFSATIDQGYLSISTLIRLAAGTRITVYGGSPSAGCTITVPVCSLSYQSP